MIPTRRLTWLVLALAVSVVPPASADSFRVYGEGGIPPGSDLFTWCDTPPCDVSAPVTCNNPEGGASLRVRTNLWGGFGLFRQANPFNLSAFAGGDLRFYVKSSYNLKVEFQCAVGQPSVDQTRTTNIAAHGWNGTNAWQEVSIPICSLFPGGTCNLECLSNVKAPFMATVADLPFFSSFQIDHVRWQTANAHSGASSVQVQGRQLFVDGEPFVVKGVAYSPISIGDNWQGAWRDRPDRYLVDFPLIAASGANVVRVYAPLLSTSMLDAAWAQGLYVIPTFQPSSAQLTCSQGLDFMKEEFRDMVSEWKDHPAILLWLVGNEFNVNLGGADICQTWYPQLDAMAEIAHATEGASFHPVSTANADTAGLGDVCQAGCSDDTSLPNLDLWSVQIYRGCSFGSLFNQFQKTDCSRPLLITEFGVDAWDSVLGIENQNLQASCLSDLLDEADQALAVRTPGGVSTGQVVFQWADEWWKADPDAANPANTCVEGATSWSTHDSCKTFNNFAYPDPGINEEWWGITGLDPAAPAARTIRTAHERMAQSYRLGTVRNANIDTFNAATGNTTVSFEPAAGSTDHTLYYGPLNAVSSYGYSGFVGGLGGTGSGSATLPPGDLFWLIVARENGAEGCYGKNSAGGERPCFPSAGGCALPQASNRNCD